MKPKEIYGSIEFISHEVRFVLGEFYNNKLNILKTETLYTDAIDKLEIIDPQQLINDVKEIISKVSDKMGFTIEKVLLLLPSYSTNRYSKRVKIKGPNNGGQLTKNDVQDTINLALNMDFQPNEILINQVINRYIIDGVSHNKLNFDKKFSKLYVDVDIYTGPKAMIFDYLSIIEQAGFEVLDIFLDSYAIATEMALLEPSREKNIIIIRYERANLTMSLINNGRIINSLMIDMGYLDLVKEFVENNNISYQNAERLILTNNYLKIQDNHTSPLFLYSKGDETKSIDDSYLNNLLLPILEKQYNEIAEMIKPILLEKETEVFITGKGASILSLGEVCSSIINSNTKVYSPAILGARKGSLVACLGAIYAYNDRSILNDVKENSVDQKEFRQEIEINKRNHTEDSMSNRFKELFKMSKDN